ncbi:NAD-dependent epimerase/dehydratase family protein [Micromonospora sp. WMMD882]|uniref:NAD-dependent epimerase/dehydratase family protein n=1 Tax=Micromonospora sp. WMMD882 TaxID=3015151 RepID=UPI00248B601B|nr:NAD-dependent epimerase/dehydratase family protein [Micromonospora sp. WMMD882]WBB77463.1 NAD-dependent epimerase/dehydratase family protein [Micromonospora sp. WMMD882]
MSTHVIVGAGPVGVTTARLLADRGDRVKLVSRRGRGPEHPAVERISADATDADRLTALATGAVALYNCLNPAYHRWATDWPPMAAALLAAAGRADAVLVTAGNLYGYGPVDGPMTEHTPERPNTVKGAVRARMWAEMSAAHRAGRVRATEVRASDFVGPGAYSVANNLILPRAATGRRVVVPADADAPHSWTYVGDLARTLVTVADDERAWGRVWHAPTPPPVSVRGLAALAAARAGARPPRVTALPRAALTLGGAVSRELREIRRIAYQFYRPFVLDSTAVTETLGLTCTPLDEAIDATVAALPAPAA